MSNIYEFYTGEQQRPAYYRFFSQNSNIPHPQPVILVFDNELENANKPLRKFTNRIKDKKRVMEEIKSVNYSRLIKDGNLYLVTHHLVDGATEGEIESLFDETTRGTELGGKKFNLASTFDTTQYYGKDIFSKHILKNYASINFAGFCPLLDCINSIITLSKQGISETSTQ